MITGTTQSGFEFKISDEVLNNWLFVEALSELEYNSLSIVKVAKLLLGTDQYEGLKKHCEYKSDRMNAEITEILSANGQTKN